jgi:hypothetical protein
MFIINITIGKLWWNKVFQKKSTNPFSAFSVKIKFHCELQNHINKIFRFIIREFIFRWIVKKALNNNDLDIIFIHKCYKMGNI